MVNVQTYFAEGSYCLLKYYMYGACMCVWEWYSDCSCLSVRCIVRTSEMHESQDVNMGKKVFYVKSNLHEVQAAENSGVLVSSICLDRPLVLPQL